MTDAQNKIPGIANPKPRRRVVQPIPDGLSAPEAPMPKITQVVAPKTNPKPASPKKASTKPRSKPKSAPKLTSKAVEVPEGAPITKSFSVTLTFPAALYTQMTENAAQYSIERPAFLKMLLKKDVVDFRNELDALEFKKMKALSIDGPSETLNHPLRLTPAQYDKIKTELDPLSLRSMSANIADALLRYLNSKYG